MPFTTTNPATGSVEQTYAGHRAGEVDARLDRAAAAYRRFRRTTFAERARLMTGAAELLEGELPVTARMVTAEMGKPFAQAKGEVAKCALALRWFAEHAERLLADEEVTARSFVRYEPIGPVLAVMPWNFPLWQVVRFAAPALMLGNVGVLKHASNVPQTALYLEDLFRRAGYPEGVFTTLLVGSAEVAGIVADDRVAAVTLTGSEAAGRSVAAAAGEALKKCVLELGGSDPFVVLASADLDEAVPTAVQARCQNNGQSCIAAKRFVVEAPVLEEFTDRFTEAMAAQTVGDPLDPATDVGPLVSESQRREIAAQVDDARDRGATVRCGGQVPDGPGWYYPPTVLTGVAPGMRAYEEEVFGPVAVVEAADDLDHALALANRTSFGLGSSVWTTDEAVQRRCVAELEAGQVFVNAMVASAPELPFGGIKRSGFGRELSGLGLREFANAKSVRLA
ncbi:MAG: NAD-dependent succinate-semialdehyde dehydrogenase [Actinomycetota bacterium]|jgi:succinate-semialdehyde dehydrogenase/glutarate-semialdehyde dehydrogenase|nr:NAD-dependent succinate-semialdehyde dehydrogenase [Actinomycetota bacterium]